MSELLSIPILVTAFGAMLVAGFLKVPIQYFIKKKLDWSLIFDTGGMPSSHSALITGAALSIGLFVGFGTPIFALAVAIATIVTYDAAGVRRQAGIHAQRINLILSEVLSGHPLSETQLKEVLGHTPFEVMAGVFTGIVTALVIWLVWPK